MKRKTLSNMAKLLTCMLTASILLTGCGKSKEIVLYGSEEEYGKAQLCDYSNLSVTKNVYEITEEMIDEQVEAQLIDNTEFTEVDRAIETDDIVSVLMTISSGSEVLYDFSDTSDDEEESGYEFTVGYEEFGAEFDQKVTGAKTGDHLFFSIDYDDDFEIEEFAGKTIDYDMTITSVSIEEVPELTDDFVKNTLGYDSIEAFRQAAEDELTAQYEETSQEELKSEMLTQIIEESTFEDYSADIISMYKASVEESYASYMEMFGASTIDEIYDMFEITSEDIEAEALNLAKQMTVLHQIGREQDIKVTKAEYDEILSQYASDYEYDSTDDLISDYGEDNLRTWILENKVYDYLIQHATITESVVSADLEEDADDEIYYDEEGMEEGILLDDADIVDMDDIMMSDEDMIEEDMTDEDDVDIDDIDLEEDFSDDTDEDVIEGDSEDLTSDDAESFDAETEEPESETEENLAVETD